MVFNLRNSWSNYILHLSSFIARKKAEISTAGTGQALISVLLIIGAEILLLIVSLPSYLAVRPLADENTKTEYHLRRKLTLGTIVTLLIIWIIKLFLILFLVWYTNTNGSLQIYETKNNSVLDTVADDVLVAELDSHLAPPVITKIQNTHKQVALWGTAPAGDAVVVAFTRTDVTNSPPKIYTTWTDRAGNFSLYEDKNVFGLPEGEYTASAITYNQTHMTKSATSRTFSFSVHRPFAEQLIHLLDIILNIIAIIAIVVGILTTILVT